MRFVNGLVGFCEGAVGVAAPVAEDRDGTVMCYNLPLYWQNK